MKIQHQQFVMLCAVMIVASSGGKALGQDSGQFRGIDKLQTNGANNNNYNSIILDRSSDNPYHIDQQDTFSGQTGNLVGSSSDTWNVGFVPVNTTVPEGMGAAAWNAAGNTPRFGEWQGNEGYQVNSGHASYDPSSDPGANDNDDLEAFTCLPWRVTPGLGDSYVIAMDAYIAEGETAVLSYMGQDAQANPTLDEMSIHLTRGTGALSNIVTWTSWWNDEEQGSPRIITAPNEELSLELGWMDNADGNDLFDVFLNGSRISGLTDATTMNTTIETAVDIFGVGFAFSGSNSYANSFTSMVPEPSSALLMIIAVVGFAGFGKRQRRKLVA